MPLRIEASELRGQRFGCLEGCAFCCLCEPGLSAEERGRFRGPLAGAVRADGGALRVVGQAGPCSLLDAQRRCSQYALRPRGCRSFPFHTTFTWRAQVSLNRGCPGTWAAGQAPAPEGFRPEEALPPEAGAALEEGRAAWARFRARAEEARCYEPPEAIARRLEACLPLLQREEGLAAGLALADAGLVVSPRNLRRGLGEVPAAALHDFLAAQARETFGQADPKRLPLYVEAREGYRWLAFRLRGERLERLEIGRDGSLAPAGSVPLLPVALLPRDEGASEVFAEHARILARRDLLVGLAAFMVDRLGYGEPLGSAALRELCAALGDLWLRASVLARFDGAAALDRDAMARGVAFFDMDFLNSPTLGVAL